MKLRSHFSLFVAALLALSPLAQAQTAPKKSEPEATVETATALSKAPTCDGDLIDELSLHVAGVRCITYFDHDCWKIFAGASMAGSAVAGSTGTYAYFAERSRKAAFAKARSVLAAEIAEKGTEELKDLYAKAMMASDDVIDGKYMTSEKMRARALQSLEKFASAEGVQAVKIQAATKAAQRVAAVQALRTAGAIGTGLAVLGGPVVTGIAVAADISLSATPAGQACVSDNSLQFVDKRPKEEGGGCEYAFDLNGSRFRSFFRQDRETQLRALKNDTATCEYMKLFNEALKGNLLTELQMLNQVKFTELPTCKVVQGGGVNYNIEYEGKNFGVASANDPETKKKIRTLEISGLSQREGIDGEMTVRFMDEAAGSSPYLITQKTVQGKPINNDFNAFLSKAAWDRRFSNAVKVLNLSQFWTPVAASCCQDHDKEKDRENCFRDKLPGLKLEEIEKKEKAAAPQETSNLLTITPGKK